MIVLWLASIFLSALFIYFGAWDKAVFGILFFAFASVGLIRRWRDRKKNGKD